jgi:hypothetical protein
MQQANSASTELATKFSLSNLDAQARKDAQALQDKINNATNAALQSLETITGGGTSSTTKDDSKHQ